MTLVWNVFRCNITSGDKIETINIFQHSKFTNEIIDIYNKQKENKLEFEKEVQKLLFYYFAFKYEYEVLICPQRVCVDNDNYLKVDVYTQIMNNKQIFMDYVYNNLTEFNI